MPDYDNDNNTNDDEVDERRPFVETPLMRIQGKDAERYAACWGVDLSDALGRELFTLEVKFMLVAHGEAQKGLPFSERIDLETFALAYRPATAAETLRALAESIRKEREERARQPFTAIPGGRP